jgi:SAM-dependent methyltransferase
VGGDIRRAQLRRALAAAGLLNVTREMRDSLLSVRELPRNWRFWLYGAEDGLPVPPLRLVRSATGTSSLAWSFHGGALAAQSIVDAVEGNGVDMRSLRRILDFGCGFGRVTRHWLHLDADVHGCDYNRHAVRWCQRNLTFAKFAVNQLEPPLPYADEYFDLVYALSVFTHLPGSLLLAWRDELSRVVKRGGFAIITTHGDGYLDELTHEEQGQFRGGGAVVRYERDAGTNRCGVYLSEDYVRRTFGARFEVVDFIPRGAQGNPPQDLVVLRKPRNPC